MPCRSQKENKVESERKKARVKISCFKPKLGKACRLPWLPEFLGFSTKYDLRWHQLAAAWSQASVSHQTEVQSWQWKHQILAARPVVSDKALAIWLFRKRIPTEMESSETSKVLIRKKRSIVCADRHTGGLKRELLSLALVVKSFTSDWYLNLCAGTQAQPKSSLGLESTWLGLKPGHNPQSSNEGHTPGFWT